MIGVTKSCTCGLIFTSLNPFRRLCDECQRVAEKERDDLVHLALAENEFEAQLWKDQLAAEGVPGVVQNVSGLVGNFGRPLPTPFSQQVWVRQSDLAAAREIIGLDPRHEYKRVRPRRRHPS